MVGRHIRRQKRIAEEARKRSYIEMYLPHIGIALQEILDLTDEQREDAFFSFRPRPATAAGRNPPDGFTGLSSRRCFALGSLSSAG